MTGVQTCALPILKAVSLALHEQPIGQIDGTILRLHVQSHDYGPLYESGKGFVRLPEIHLVIDRLEVLQ